MTHHSETDVNRHRQAFKTPAGGVLPPLTASAAHVFMIACNRAFVL